jgi:hypothetical protein
MTSLTYYDIMAYFHHGVIFYVTYVIILYVTLYVTWICMSHVILLKRLASLINTLSPLRSY